jgi:hypothetical protein
MSHTMKLWKRIIEHRLRGVTNVIKNQFSFMPGRSTMEAIFLIKQLMKRCMEQKKDLHIIFIDLDKAYDKSAYEYHVVSLAEAQNFNKLHYPH